MGYLIADSTASVSFTPNTPADSVTLVVTGRDGVTVDVGQPANTDGVWGLTIPHDAGLTLWMRYDFAWTIVVASQTRIVHETYWILDDEYPGYGDVEGVARLLLMVTLTGTSQPSVRSLVDFAAMQRRALDAAFDPDPRWTWAMWEQRDYDPYYWPAPGATGTLGMANVAADPTALAMLADAENLLTAAALLETMGSLRSPDAGTDPLPAAWRDQARVLAMRARKRHHTSPTQQGTHTRRHRG